MLGAIAPRTILFFHFHLQTVELSVKRFAKRHIPLGCTIRNTPSEPIHCIVWSKHLFNQVSCHIIFWCTR